MRRIMAPQLLVLLLTAATGASAQSPKPADPFAQLTACRGITADAERLACFDKAAARLAEATASREVVVVDREEIKRTRRSLFGFELPRVGLFGGGEKAGAAERIEEISTTITTVRDLGHGKYSLVVAEGGTWQTTEALRGKLPKRGDTVTIKSGALGSYWLTVAGGRGVRAMRVG